MTDDLLAPDLAVVADVLPQAIVVYLCIDADDIAEMREDSLKFSPEIAINSIERCCNYSQLLGLVDYLP